MMVERRGESLLVVEVKLVKLFTSVTSPLELLYRNQEHKTI